MGLASIVKRLIDGTKGAIRSGADTAASYSPNPMSVYIAESVANRAVDLVGSAGLIVEQGVASQAANSTIPGISDWGRDTSVVHRVAHAAARDGVAETASAIADGAMQQASEFAGELRSGDLDAWGDLSFGIFEATMPASLLAKGKFVSKVADLPTSRAPDAPSAAPVANQVPSASPSNALDMIPEGQRIVRQDAVAGAAHPAMNSRPRYSHDPRYQLVETHRPLADGNGWQHRWMRMSETDHQAYRNALADEISLLHGQSSQSGSLHSNMLHMSQFRKNWLERYRRERDGCK